MPSTETRIVIKEMAAEGRLMEFAQELVNRFALILAERHPDVAAKTPKKIGEFAKKMVMSHIAASVYDDKEEFKEKLDQIWDAI